MVDPLTTTAVLTALCAGSAEGILDSVKDSARKLVETVRTKFQDLGEMEASDATLLFSRYPTDSQAAEVVRSSLDRTGLINDVEIQALATGVIKGGSPNQSFTLVNSGHRAVVAGGNISRSTIITGDGNGFQQP